MLQSKTVLNIPRFAPTVYRKQSRHMFRRPLTLLTVDDGQHRKTVGFLDFLRVSTFANLPFRGVKTKGDKSTLHNK